MFILYVFQRITPKMYHAHFRRMHATKIYVMQIGFPPNMCSFQRRFLQSISLAHVAKCLVQHGYTFIGHDCRGTGMSTAVKSDRDGLDQFTFDIFAHDAAEVVCSLNQRRTFGCM